MQKPPDLRLVVMSATGDHQLVEKRIPYFGHEGSDASGWKIFLVATHGKDS